MGESLKNPSAPASTTDTTDTPTRTDCVRYSMRNVTSAMTATNPRRLRVPKMP